MNSHDALELVLKRNAFYRRMHFLVMGAFFLSLVLMGVLIWTILYLRDNPTKPYYFAANNVGVLLQYVPVSTPNMSDEQVIAWTVKAVQAANTYDFINYSSQLQSAQKYFTARGWREYMKAIVASNNLLGVINRKLVAIATVVPDQIQILKRALLNGAYAWQITMPVLVTIYQPPEYSDATKYGSALQVTVIVQRQQALEGNSGLAIVQLISSLQTDLPATPQQ